MEFGKKIFVKLNYLIFLDWTFLNFLAYCVTLNTTLLVKNNYYESSTLTAKKGPMKTAAQNRSANSDGSVIARGPTFSLVNALVYVEHRPGHSLGKK